MNLAWMEMERITDKERVKVALSRNVTYAAEEELRVLEQVLVYRERPLIKWTGPHTVVNVKVKAIQI